MKKYFLAEFIIFGLMFSFGVMASGGGSNFKALLSKVKEGLLPAKCLFLIVNNGDCGAVQIAKEYGLDNEKVIRNLMYRERRSAHPGNSKSRGRKPAKTLQEYKSIISAILLDLSKIFLILHCLMRRRILCRELGTVLMY